MSVQPAGNGLDDGVVVVPAEEGLGQGVQELHQRHRHGPEVRGGSLWG